MNWYIVTITCVSIVSVAWVLRAVVVAAVALTPPPPIQGSTGTVMISGMGGNEATIVPPPKPEDSKRSVTPRLRPVGDDE